GDRAVAARPEVEHQADRPDTGSEGRRPAAAAPYLAGCIQPMGTNSFRGRVPAERTVNPSRRSLADATSRGQPTWALNGSYPLSWLRLPQEAPCNGSVIGTTAACAQGEESPAGAP